MKTLADYHWEDDRFVPRYELLRRWLKDYLCSLPPGHDYLPTQEMLAKTHGVSRKTVRRALRKLADDGYVTTTRRVGSRRLNRAAGAHAEVKPVQDGRPRIGFIFANNLDGKLRSTYRVWKLLDEAERIFSAAAVELIAYNLREDGWMAWNPPEKLVESLRFNRIRTVMIFPAILGGYAIQELLKLLRQARIRIIYTLPDTYDFYLNAPLIRPGEAFCCADVLGSIPEALAQFPGIEAVAFYRNIHQHFAERRREVCRVFAGNRNLPFADCVSETPEQVPDLGSDESAEAFLAFARPFRHVLCIGANDMLCAFLKRRLALRDTLRNTRIEYLGFDNTESPKNNFSTFDFDQSACAQAALELYREMRDGAVSPYRIFPAKFIRRPE